MTHKYVEMLADPPAYLREVPKVPDDRNTWGRPGQHSNTDDGRLLARIDERVANITRQIDDIAQTAHDLIEGLDLKIQKLDARVVILENNQVRWIAYLTAGGVIVTIIWPMIRAYLHIPVP